MHQIKMVFSALLLASIIVFAVSKEETISWQLPEGILAKEELTQNHEVESFQGFPAELEGVWHYTALDGSVQSLTLHNRQLTVSTEANGRIYYDNIVTQRQQVKSLLASPIASKSYSLVWDINAFIERYGEENLSTDPAPFILYYDETNDQLSASSTIVYHRSSEAELIYELKQQLIEQMPINDSQLASMNDQILLELWQAAQQKELAPEKLNLYLYKGLAAYYPEISLLNLSEIEEYQTLIHEIMKRTSLTYEEINQASPKKLLTTFKQLEKEMVNEELIEEVDGNQMSKVYDVLLEEVDLLRNEYQKETFEKESKEALIVAQ